MGNHSLRRAIALSILAISMSVHCVNGGLLLQTQPTDGARDELSLPVAEFEVKNATFRQAVGGLVRQSHANIAVRWDALEGHAISPHDTIALHLWNTTVGRVLRTLVTLENAADRVSINVDDGIICLTAIEEDRSSLATQVYDIRDILDMAVEYERSRAEVSSSTVVKHEALVPPQTVADAIDAIMHLIESTVDVDSWKDNGGAAGFIQEFGGMLIVQQMPANHQKIVALLRGIRAGEKKKG